MYNNVMEKLLDCEKCGTHYHFKGSTASLKMTYCSIMCEVTGLGFSLEALEKNKYERMIAQPIRVDLPPEEIVEIAEQVVRNIDDDRDLVSA
jgi:hypothetical protein